jgi:lia operon protein LiaG
MRKIMYGALGLVLIGVIGVIMSINTSGVEAFTFSSVDVKDTKDVSAKGVKNIVIDSSSVDVNIQPGSGDKIEADFSGQVGKKSKDLYKLDIDKDGDTVKITMDKKDKFQFMMFNFTKVSLNVTVPQQVYEDIEINGASADISIEEVEAKELAIETESGDIEASDVVVKGALVLKASSGDITANGNSSKTLDIETSSGDMKLKDNQAKVTNFSSSSGDIVSDDLISDNIKMNSSSGDIVVSAEEMTGNVSLESSSGDIDVSFAKAAPSIKVDYKSSSGDGKANLDDMNYSDQSENRIVGQRGDGKFKLTARTSSGDFTIKD